MVFSIPLSLILGGFYLKSQKMKMLHGDAQNSSDLRQQVGNLMAENEEINERLKKLEYLLGDEARRINLDYEKEQILVDTKNKFNY